MKTVEAPTPDIGLRRPVKPGYFRVGWATFGGYVWALLALLPVGIVAYLVGVDAFGWSDSSGRGAFYRFDVWSYLAEACVGVFVTAVTAFFVRYQLIKGTGWEVSYGFAFVVLLVTGYAPAAALTPLYGATAFVSLLLATVALRWRCEPAGAEPLPLLSAVPRRYRRRAAIGICVGVPLIAAYAVAYGATHPLRWDGSVSFGPNGTATAQDAGAPQYKRSPGAIERYVFPVENLGRFDVDDVRLVSVEGNPVFQLEVAGVVGDGGESWARGRLNPLGELQLPARQTRYLALEFRQGRSCVGPKAQLDAVRLQFTVLGGTFEERMPLIDPPTIRC